MKEMPQKAAQGHLWHRYRFSLVVALLIMVAVLLPGKTFNTIQVNIIGVDKIVHFLMFFTFSLVFSIEYRKDKKRLPHILTLILLLTGFALFTETSQFFAEGRSFDLFDGLFDLLGAVTARMAIGLFHRFGKKSISPVFQTRGSSKNN